METSIFWGLILLLLTALFVPVGNYLLVGWKLRHHEIVTCFTDDALGEYIKTIFPIDFLPVDDNGEPDWVAVRERFNAFLQRSTGRPNFSIPSLLLLMTGGFLLFLNVKSAWPWVANLWSHELEVSQSTLPLIAVSGFAGGYMWALQYLLLRAQARHLAPADLCWASFRMLIAIPVALAISAIAGGALTEHAQYALALMLGAFPTQTLFTFMRRTASKRLGLGETLAETGEELTNLQGVGRDEAERFVQEGFGKILQLAYSDPVDLTIRTGFSFNYVVDCNSQAIAWLTFGDDLKKLRRYGLRGAQEISTLIMELDRRIDQEEDTKDKEQRLAEAALAALAADLGMSQELLRRMLYEIAWDPYTAMLANIWQSGWN